MRRCYLISYDISSDKRRNQVFDLLTANGDRVQYSVFFCELNKKELATLKLEITPIINNNEDQVLFVDMGEARSAVENRVEALGQAYVPPSRVLVV